MLIIIATHAHNFSSSTTAGNKAVKQLFASGIMLELVPAWQVLLMVFINLFDEIFCPLIMCFGNILIRHVRYQKASFFLIFLTLHFSFPFWEQCDFVFLRQILEHFTHINLSALALQCFGQGSNIDRHFLTAGMEGFECYL